MKKTILTTTITIGTHDGAFHADDLAGFALLRLRYENVSLIRSREIGRASCRERV